MTPSEPATPAPARAYAGRSAEDRRAERRARLVAATVRLVGERGASAATMTAICAEAGLTERYFYESFRGREQVLVAALDAVADQIATAAVRAIEATDGGAGVRVHAALSRLVAWVDEHPGPARVALVESTTEPALRDRRRQLLGTFAELVATEARELYGDEVWPPDRARVQGLLYVAGLAELVSARLAGEVTLEAEELVEIGSEALRRLARA